MSEVKNLTAVIQKLRFRKTRGKRSPVAVVGYAMPYAPYVHENLKAHHAEGKFAKFLETPARQYRKETAQIIEEAYEKTHDLELALLMGALFLQRMSQEIVPVDTGALRASAYVALEKDKDDAAQAAYERAQAFRTKVLKTRRSR